MFALVPTRISPHPRRLLPTANQWLVKHGKPSPIVKTITSSPNQSLISAAFFALTRAHGTSFNTIRTNALAYCKCSAFACGRR